MPQVEHQDDRLTRLEQELQGVRQQIWRWQAGALALGTVIIGGILLGPTFGHAGKWRDNLEISSRDGRQSAEISPDGLRFFVDGSERIALATGDDWSSISLMGSSGQPAWSVTTDGGGTAMKIFSEEAKLRVEIAEHLLDSGSGMRLYDSDGHPRATFYAQQRGQESGLLLTDPDRQPRIDISAQPQGVSVIRAMDGDAKSLAEVSVLHASDALSRYTGKTPSPKAEERLAPMVYLVDDRGNHTLLMPALPE